MDAARRRDLEVIMAGLAAGDAAMVVALVDRFGGELRRTLIALARTAELRRPPDEELDGLVYDAALAIARVARAWRPDGGALPGVWARQRLLRVLWEAAGPPAILVAGLRVEQPAADDLSWRGTEPPALVVLAGAARRHAGAALVEEALTIAVRERDREVLLRHADQVGAGDPSPAVTVGRELGRSPDAVRQAVSRGRRRLRDLAEADSRFRPLLRLPLLGPASEQAA